MPNILIVNDDGIDAPGLTTLVQKLDEVEDLNVFVVAPAEERSAFSHSISIGQVLSAQVRKVAGAKMAFAVGGTPADCTMIALGALFPGVAFDCVIGGINRGDNAGRHIIYSGTVGSAREAACHGLVSIATSLDSQSKTANYEASAALTTAFTVELISRPDLLRSLRGRVVNINYPDLPLEEIKGWRATLPGAWTYRDHWKTVPAPSASGAGGQEKDVTKEGGPNAQAIAEQTQDLPKAVKENLNTDALVPGIRGDGTWDAEPGHTYYFTNTSAPPFKDEYVDFFTICVPQLSFVVTVWS